MGKARRKFDERYKREAVRFLEETGRPLREVAAELEVAEQSLWRWRKQYGTGAWEALSPSEREELRRLRRENARLQQEREFLKKAAAYFANPSP
jgi:transposase